MDEHPDASEVSEAFWQIEQEHAHDLIDSGKGEEGLRLLIVGFLRHLDPDAERTEQEQQQLEVVREYLRADIDLAEVQGERARCEQKLAEMKVEFCRVALGMVDSYLDPT